jgi:hypothetical protein
MALTGGSGASDVEALTSLLAEAFIADQTVFMCALEFPAFVQETAGPRGTSRDYREHVREEILSSLSPVEANRLIVGAAEIAREAGCRQARTFSPNYPDIPAAALRTWCDTDGRGVVRAFMAKHDNDQIKFLSAIAQAKRPAM